MAGYGIGPWGATTWGATGTIPTVTSAVSLDGFRIEVFFSEDMNPNAAFTDPVNYVLTPFYGAPATTLSVVAGSMGATGPTSAIITHTGTTLGCLYRVSVHNVESKAGTGIDPIDNYADLLTKGEAPTYTVTPTAGNEILLQFSQDMLPESVVSPGIEQISAYKFDMTPPTYPIPITVQTVSHPYSGNLKEVNLEVQGMTSIVYDCTVGFADAIIFDGTYLPSSGTTFTGIELGTGSTVAGTSELYISKLAGNTYGWGFIDTSGKYTTTATVESKLRIDASLGTYTPPIGDGVFGTFSVSDGTTQIDVVLEQVAAQKKVTVTSGAFSRQANYDWSVGAFDLRVIRNLKSGHYAVVVDDTPLVADPIASFTGPPTILGGNPGCQFLLSTVYDISNFLLYAVDVTATETIFGSTWNFVHNSAQSFTGLAAFTNGSLFTDYGPLVKGWGDATPASKQDVTVYLNGTPYTWIDNVNPYTGEITFSIPIPLMPPGTNTVEVDYIWFANPIFPMAGFNTAGLLFNQWGRPDGIGAYPPAHGEQIQSLPNFPKGALTTSRFPFSSLMGPWAATNPQPIHIGHRYLGLERASSATFNNPTTLLFNQDPNSVEPPALERTPPAVSEVFEGVRDPQFDDPPWVLVGDDRGSPDAVTGIYTLKDESTGSYGIGEVAFYERDADLTYPSAVVVAARYEIDSYTADGAFTGVGFGVHDNRRLYLVGNLISNGLQHVGMLKDPGKPQDILSWDVGPSTEIEILTNKTFLADSSTIPVDVVVGTRFQIFTGSQAGVYTIKTKVAQLDGDTLVTVDDTVSTFPADPNLWGNKYHTIAYEVIWANKPSTYRLVVEPDQNLAEFIIGGAISATVLVFDNPPEYPIPPNTTLLLQTERGGQVFWGSISREAMSVSEWSFFRYGILPDQTTLTSKGHVVSSEMTETPDVDPNSEWFEAQDFGYAEVDATGNQLLLKGTSGSNSTDTQFAYKRVEPFLKPSVMADFDAKFRLETGVLGAGDALMRVWDTEHDIRLGTILYEETPGDPNNYRSLLAIPNESLSGLYKPSDAGWVGGGTDFTEEVENHVYNATVTAGSGFWRYNRELSLGTFIDQGSRIMEARVAVQSYTFDVLTRNTGIFFVCECFDGIGTPRLVGLTLLAPDSLNAAKVGIFAPVNFDSIGPISSSEYTFDWTDTEFHTYRVLIDGVADTVTLVIDDVVQAPTLALALFLPAPQTNRVTLGQTNFYGTQTALDVDSFSFQAQPANTAKRTLGVWKGGDLDDIDNWELPRTDSFTVPNRNQAAVIEEMDWRSDIELRLRRDPGWGVTVYRPDLPPPPYFTGTFATRMTEPSAGWINVEIGDLPPTLAPFGGFAFGAADPRSISQQRWDYVRYRYYKPEFDDPVEPRQMVFNQYHVISSGEYNNDDTLEVVVVESMGSTSVSLIPANIFADRVFQLLDDGDTILPDKFTFKPESQTIFLNSGVAFSGSHVPITITFAPGKPITKTYLEGQPLLASTELVNEGTPAYLRHLTEDPTRNVVFGQVVTDPDGDQIDNTPYRQVEFDDTDNTLYECMEFFDVNNGGVEGLIHPFCDSPFPGHGLIEMSLEGPLLTEINAPGPKNQPFPFPGYIMASGGTFEDGVLGPVPVTGSAIMFPNQQGLNIKPGSQNMGLNQSVRMVMIDGGVVVLLREW